jgi:hypothetical protein
MQLARKRYPTANPVPRSLRKQAIRNLRAIERGDYSAVHKQAAEAAESEWKVIADRLSKAGWSLGWVSAVDAEGRTIWTVDAQRGDGRRFIVHADEKLSAFVELERQVLTVAFYLESIHADSCR